MIVGSAVSYLFLNAVYNIYKMITILLNSTRYVQGQARDTVHNNKQHSNCITLVNTDIK